MNNLYFHVVSNMLDVVSLDGQSTQAKTNKLNLPANVTYNWK